ncbi:MAG TPA: CRISPR-associated endoribonuclease Cas6 [Candidatus Methanoperedens sp.]|nr:CRISPR-associated endoribonuclease Cas6 [Candidatus Methanoperedens sp.]
MPLTKVSHKFQVVIPKEVRESLGISQGDKLEVYEKNHERFSEFYDKAPIDHFDVIETANIKPKRIKIAEGYRRCTLMSLRIQASPELLKFAYEAGLGEKNAMGFGCVDVVGPNQSIR